MDEYIERGAAIDRLEKLFKLQAPTARAIVEAIPAADVAPVRHGRWELSYMDDFLVCSECVHYWIYKGDQYDYHYCPNCGAKMDGGET
jgi:zona occludens toxin (predicted ATPase)